MIEKNMKQALKEAYRINPSDSEKAFLRQHERRSLQMLEVLKIEFRYMGIKSMFAGVLLCLIV